jgi:hypothetical protein
VRVSPQSIRDLRPTILNRIARVFAQAVPQLQRQGIVPAGGSERITILFEVLLAFQPNKKSEEIIHAEALREFNRFVELRRSRLANVLLGLVSVLWWVVAFGALFNIMLIWPQDMEIHVHLILGGVLASILGLVIFLIAELDNPFRGEVSGGPNSIALVYETLMKPGMTAKPVEAR